MERYSCCSDQPDGLFLTNTVQFRTRRGVTLQAVVAGSVTLGSVPFVLALVAGLAWLDVQAGPAQLLTLQLGLAGELGAKGLSRRLLRLGRACGCRCTDALTGALRGRGGCCSTALPVVLGRCRARTENL